MSFLKKISSLFAAPGASKDPAYWIAVKCNHCGETIRARVDLRNDLSINYGDRDDETTYFCRKMLMGSQQCYQKIEVELTFDANRKLVRKEIRGGKYVIEGES